MDSACFCINAPYLHKDLLEWLMANQCKFWDCSQTITSLHSYCIDHFDLEKSGHVDECPTCDRAKFSKSRICGVCEDFSERILTTAETQYALLKLIESIDELMLDFGSESHPLVRQKLLELVRKNSDIVKKQISPFK